MNSVEFDTEDRYDFDKNFDPKDPSTHGPNMGKGCVVLLGLFTLITIISVILIVIF